MTSAAVYGTGSWGTAYASVLADAGTSVTKWGRRQEVVDQINAGNFSRISSSPQIIPARGFYPLQRSRAAFQQARNAGEELIS